MTDFSDTHGQPTGLSEHGSPGSSRLFVVIEGGRFTFCPRGAGLREIDLSELSSLAAGRPAPEHRSFTLAPEVAKRSTAGSDLPAPSSPDFGRAVVRPGRGVVAELGGECAHVYVDLHRTWIRMGSDHLHLAAAIKSRVTVSELQQRAIVPADVFHGVLRDLVAVGVVLTSGSGSPQFHSGPGRMEPRDSSGGNADAWPANRQGATEARRAVASNDRPRFGMDGRIPVFSFWATDEGPHHGSAAVVAYARVAFGGTLNEQFELLRTHPAEQMLDDLRHTTGPAVVLCSDYIWSFDVNLRIAAKALEANPATIVIHGGPCAPKYEGDCERLLRSLPPGHVVIPGEGEITFAETLAALARGRDPVSGLLRVEALAEVLGVAYLDPSAQKIVRTAERPRHTHLEDFPSAFMSGEYDDVSPEVLCSATNWPVESVRGCPYGCTFCDWGSATMTKIRKFPMERVVADMEWITAKGCRALYIADANFGMLPRDSEIAEEVIRIHRKSGSRAAFFSFSPAKSAPKRLTSILETLLDAGLMVRVPLAMQSRDQPTLDTVQRHNIKNTTYDELGRFMRRRGIPVTVELMVGLPGATLASYKDDLQWSIDQQVIVMRYSAFLLPNSPMNDPEYKRQWAIEAENGVIVATSTYTREERREMDRLSYAYQCLEALGILRHVLRYLQWDHGQRAIDVIHDLQRIAHERPDEAPLLHWLFNTADQFLVPPVGWAPLYDEIHRLLVGHLGVTDDAGLRTAFAVNQFLMPVRGRSCPDALELEHDYVSYYRSALIDLYATGQSGTPERRLEEYGAGRLEAQDPENLPSSMMGRLAEDRLNIDDASTRTFSPFWMQAHLELWSLVVALPPLISVELAPHVRELVTERYRFAGGTADVAAPDEPGSPSTCQTQPLA